MSNKTITKVLADYDNLKDKKHLTLVKIPYDIPINQLLKNFQRNKINSKFMDKEYMQEILNTHINDINIMSLFNNCSNIIDDLVKKYNYLKHDYISFFTQNLIMIYKVLGKNLSTIIQIYNFILLQIIPKQIMFTVNLIESIRYQIVSKKLCI